MNEATEGAPSSGAAETTPNGASRAPEGTNGGPSSATASASTAIDPAAAAPSIVQEAMVLIKRHPLGAVATLAAATALLEVELAVGILAGLGASALLTNESGPATRKRVFERGKQALARARSAIHNSALQRKAKAATAPAAPSPAAPSPEVQPPV